MQVELGTPFLDNANQGSPPLSVQLIRIHVRDVDQLVKDVILFPLNSFTKTRRL
jgi:hypothetical protein